jgi:RNA polymerase sigma-70 factor (ECF subfamily)
LQDNTGRIEDHVLVARVVAGQDTSAFGELVRRHQSQVRNFLRRLARDDTLADDLAQDCFLHAWDKIHTYTGSGSFIGWLMKVAYTTFLQSKRKSKRYSEVLERAGSEPVATTVGAGEDTLDLEKLLAAMDEQERVIMVFSYACGLSHREISEATDIPAGTVKSIIHRAKEKIRARFEIESYQHG